MKTPILDKRFFCDYIQKFYAQVGRHFKWRWETDPYRVLLTEILLKKTTAKKVETIYDKFFAEYSGWGNLASAAPRDLQRNLRHLGLQKQRTKTLVELAQVLQLKHGSKVPSTYDELVSLPGVGRYTANAVLCFAYGKPRPVVDVNVARVFHRFFGLPLARDVNRAEQLWGLAEQLLPKSRFKEHNLGVIDFAAKICRAVRPKCGECSLAPRCVYFAARRGGNNKK
jgi:A/G-specific adenine glycosylase